MLRDLQAARPFLQRVEMAGGIGAADHGADRGADDDIRHDAMGQQGPDDADMGEAARRAAAQRQSDHRLADRAKADLVAAFSAALAASNQHIQHCTLQGVVPPGQETSQPD